MPKTLTPPAAAVCTPCSCGSRCPMQSATARRPFGTIRICRCSSSAASACGCWPAAPSVRPRPPRSIHRSWAWIWLPPALPAPACASPSAARRPRASCSSAACRSAKTSSCGGTSWHGTRRRWSRRRGIGIPDSDSARSTAVLPRLCPPRSSPDCTCVRPAGNAPRLLEDDRSPAVQEYAMLGGVAHRRRQRAPFGVTAGRDQHVGRVAVIDALDDLLDDRTLIEIGSHVMGGGTDHLDAAVIGLVVRFGTLEPRQERVMYVDGAPPQPLAQIV